MSFQSCVQQCKGAERVYPFPRLDRDPQMRKIWLRLLGIKSSESTNQNLYACDKHFSCSMKIDLRLRYGAYPDQNLPINKVLPTIKPNMAKQNRRKFPKPQKLYAVLKEPSEEAAPVVVKSSNLASSVTISRVPTKMVNSIANAPVTLNTKVPNMPIATSVPIIPINASIKSIMQSNPAVTTLPPTPVILSNTILRSANTNLNTIETSQPLAALNKFVRIIPKSRANILFTPVNKVQMQGNVSNFTTTRNVNSSDYTASQVQVVPVSVTAQQLCAERQMSTILRPSFNPEMQTIIRQASPPLPAIISMNIDSDSETELMAPQFPSHENKVPMLVQSLGVFTKEQKGISVSLKQITSAVDPLERTPNLVFDKQINPILPIDTYYIDSEEYAREVLHSVDTIESDDLLTNPSDSTEDLSESDNESCKPANENLGKIQYQTVQMVNISAAGEGQTPTIETVASDLIEELITPDSQFLETFNSTNLNNNWCNANGITAHPPSRNMACSPTIRNRLNNYTKRFLMQTDSHNQLNVRKFTFRNGTCFITTTKPRLLDSIEVCDKATQTTFSQQHNIDLSEKINRLELQVDQRNAEIKQLRSSLDRSKERNSQIPRLERRLQELKQQNLQLKRKLDDANHDQFIKVKSQYGQDYITNGEEEIVILIDEYNKD